MTGLQRQLSTAIVAALQRHGVTQKTLAIRTGFSEKHVSRLLTGQAEGSFDAWERIAMALGTEWHVALGDQGV